MAINATVFVDNIIGASNGDFETGDLTYWNIYYSWEGAGSASTDAASSGTYGCKLELIDAIPETPYSSPDIIVLYSDIISDLSDITNIDFKIDYLDAASNQGVEIVIYGIDPLDSIDYLILDATYDSTTDWISIDSGSFEEPMPTVSGGLNIIVAAWGEYIPPTPPHAILYVDGISFSGVQLINSTISSTSQIISSLDTTPIQFYIKEVLCMGSPQEYISTTDLGHEVMERTLNDTPTFTDIGHTTIDLYHTDVGHSIALKTYPDFTTYGIKIIKQIINFLHARMRRSK